MAEIPKDHHSSLEEWLDQAAKGIHVHELNDRDYLRWAVEVHNGLSGRDAMGAILAVTSSELEAELVAVALWAAVRQRAADQGWVKRDG